MLSEEQGGHYYFYLTARVGTSKFNYVLLGVMIDTMLILFSIVFS